MGRSCSVSLSPRPASGFQSRPFGGCFLDCVGPGDLPGPVHENRHEHPAVQTSTAGAEAFQAVDGGQAGFRIVEYEQFPAHDAPVAHLRIGRAFGQFSRLNVTCKASLRGRIGRRIGGSNGEDVRSSGTFEKRDPIGPDIQASPDQRTLQSPARCDSNRRGSSNRASECRRRRGKS